MAYCKYFLHKYKFAIINTIIGVGLIATIIELIKTKKKYRKLANFHNEVKEYLEDTNNNKTDKDFDEWKAEKEGKIKIVDDITDDELDNTDDPSLDDLDTEDDLEDEVDEAEKDKYECWDDYRGN